MKQYTVYKHTNKINGKVYIGITCQNVKDRWGRGSTYQAQHFGRAIKNYGWDSFEHLIIAKGLSRKDACELERLLIKAYDSTNPQKGYNETLGGDGGGMYKKHHTKESKEKISKARKKDGFTETHKKHISESKQGVKHHFAKKVFQYTKDGEFIKKWEYISLAAYVWKYERE